MSPSYDKSAAIVVLPSFADERIADRFGWLARADLCFTDGPSAPLERVLDAIGKRAPPDGQGALRMWGQTGDRPTAWVAAADPVYLEPRMDHLWLHALPPSEFEAAELRRLVDHLQRTLGETSSFGFARLGGLGYVTADAPVATASVPAAALDQCAPDDFLPAGPAAAGHRRLISEIEMALHEHPVNRDREAAGLKPVNSLWLWGGGLAPEPETEPHPPLFTDDPLMTGYWLSKTAPANAWPGSIEDCLNAADRGFVAVLSDEWGDAELARDVKALRAALRSGRLRRLILLFRDGLSADVTRWHALRVWRRRGALTAARRGA